MNERADQDRCREDKTDHPELRWAWKHRSAVMGAKLELWSRDRAGVVFRETVDQVAGNLSCLAERSEDPGEFRDEPRQLLDCLAVAQR
jgi:hypothetical protein